MDNSRWPVSEGLVNQKKVKVLGDSGCSSVLVRNTLVNEGDMLGKSGFIKLATNEVRETPLAIIYIDTPYYKGQVDAFVLENPIYDLIIGNIEKSLPPFSPDPNWSMEGNKTVISTTNNEAHITAPVRAIVTKGMARGIKWP